MNKQYMNYGRIVRYSDTEYRLIQDMDEAENGNVKAIRLNDYRRYDLLRAWSRNHVGLTEEQRQEMDSLVCFIPCDECVPTDKIRFIDPNYNTLFTVTNGDTVRVNGSEYEVYALDEGAYHIALIDKDGHNAANVYGGCFHICQFAEIAEKNNWNVEPVA